MNNLLLPWQPGFWETYYSKLPPNWTDLLKNGTAYLAPSLTTGELTTISCPEEFEDYRSEFEAWHSNSLIDPLADPFKGWYPLCELDRASKDNELDLVA